MVRLFVLAMLNFATQVKMKGSDPSHRGGEVCLKNGGVVLESNRRSVFPAIQPALWTSPYVERAIVFRVIWCGKACSWMHGSGWMIRREFPRGRGPNGKNHQLWNQPSFFGATRLALIKSPEMQSENLSWPCWHVHFGLGYLGPSVKSVREKTASEAIPAHMRAQIV